jgi:putative endonuclease
MSVFCVYIIYSKKLNRFYVGTTDNFTVRLMEHNTPRAFDAFTSRGIPWQEYLVIEGLTSSQAYLLERKLKAMKSKKYYENLKKYPEMRQRVINERCLSV